MSSFKESLRRFGSHGYRVGPLGLLFALAFPAAIPSSAQLTFPGRVRIQLPNGRNPASPQRLPARESADRVCPNLVSWAKPLFDEYPQQDLMHVELGRLARMEIPLFADQNFKAFFHESYTELTPQDLDTIFHQQIIVCDQSSYRTQLPGLEYAFQIRSTTSPLSYTHLPASLAALQAARENIARQLNAMQSLPASQQGYGSLRAFQTTAAADLSLVWPSERRTFQQAFSVAQARLAPAALNAGIEALLAATPSLDTLRTLREAPSTYRDLFSQVPQEQSAGLRARLDSRATAIGTAVIAEQRGTMVSFTGTQDGLKQGAAWLQQFEAVDVNELNLPGAAALAADYEQKRARQLSAYEPHLRHTIQTAPSEEALQAILDEAYPLPSDRTTPAFSLMQQAVAQRAAVFQKQRASQDAGRQRAEDAREARLSAQSSASGRPGAHSRDSAGGAEPEVHAGFTADGLQSQAVLLAIYQGNFDKIDFGRDDLRFAALANDYMKAYWDNCSRFLTADRVAMTVLTCTGGYSHMVNLRTGMQTSPDTCQGWSEVPTERFADRQLYSAVKDLEGQQQKKAIGDIFKQITNARTMSDLFPDPTNALAAAAQIDHDARALVTMNGCTSPELKHFQNNLLAFSQGGLSTRPDGSRTEYAATRAAPPGQAFQDSNYQRMLGDMVADHATSWMVNRYVPGSIRGVQVNKRDVMGRPVSISGAYEYAGGEGDKHSGKVTLDFSDGLPECMYFSDLPSNCVTPDRKLITAYGNGSYRQ